MASAVPRRASRRDPFFPLMALLIAAIVAAGFGPSYAASLAPPGLPFWVHLHGAVMTGWVLLFAAQAWLVRTRAVALHRRLGWASLALVAAMVPLGVATDLLAVRRGATPPFFTPAGMIAADWCDLAAFVGLFGAAVARRRRVHPAYWWGVGAIVVAQVTHPLVAATPPIRALAARLVAGATSFS